MKFTFQNNVRSIPSKRDLWNPESGIETQERKQRYDFPWTSGS